MVNSLYKSIFKIFSLAVVISQAEVENLSENKWSKPKNGHIKNQNVYINEKNCTP